MLACLLTTCLLCPATQQPQTALASAVAVRGEAELTPAAALASAEARLDEHVRDVWRDRALRASERQLPFWLPDVLTRESMRRWLADLPVEQLVRRVDREDRERVHEFGNSYQTTLWVAEEPKAVQRGERALRAELRRLERSTAARYGGVAAGWVVLALALGWLDRLSRGYMTGRLRLLGVLLGAAMPALAFLV